MLLTFIDLPGFVSDAKALGLVDDDLRGIERALLRQPELGAVMAGTVGLRKMRWSPAHRASGKSAGVNVCYAVFKAPATAVMVVAFGKSDRASLTPAERNTIKAMLARITKGLEIK